MTSAIAAAKHNHESRDSSALAKGLTRTSLKGGHPHTLVGTTLIELVVTLAIAALLLTIAVPSFQNVIRTNRIAALTNEFSAALQLARSEAVTRGQRVTVCKSGNVTASAPTCSTSADHPWEGGWLVFVDINSNGTYDDTFPDGTGTLLRVGQPTISAAAITSDGTKFMNFIGFTPTGESVGASEDGDTLEICIAPDQRSIVINPIGRMRIEAGTCP